MSDDYGNRPYRFSIHGQPWYWSRVWNRQRRSHRKFEPPFKFNPGETPHLGPIIETDNLLAVYEELERNGGPAPGPDGIHFGDLGRRERADVLRDVSRQLRDVTYRPGETLQCERPKPGGGTRTLKIRNIIDRVVSKAVTVAITPVIDARFLDCSMGFRPGRNISQVFAQLEAAVIQQDRTVLVTDDIRKAFDFVPIDTAVTAFAAHIFDGQVLRLIEVILRGHEGTSRQVGIDQGDPLSALGLNTLLDQALDRQILAASPGTPYWRYADNTVWTGQDVSEGQHVLHEACQLLGRVGLSLKGEQLPVDLSEHGTSISTLGLNVRRNEDQLIYGLTGSSWRNLESQLLLALDGPNPTGLANQVLQGWLEGRGMAFGDDVGRRAVLRRVLRTTSRLGLREVKPGEVWLEVMEGAYGRWMDLRARLLSTDTSHHRTLSPSLYGGYALRASQRPRIAPCRDAEAGLIGDSSPESGSIP